jgi:iron(III) transport system permease protein
MNRRALAAWLANLILLAALFAIVGWPLTATVLESSGIAISPSSLPPGELLLPPADEAAQLANRPWNLAKNSLALVGLTEAIAMPLGILLAVILVRTRVWGRRLWLGILAALLFVPMPLHATAWLGAIGNAGRSQAIGAVPILVGIPGAAFVHAVAAIPWIVFLVGIGLRHVERGLEESARLDLPLWRVLWSITLRRSLGAIVAALLAVAVLTAGDMTVTDLLQVRTYSEEVYIQSQLGDGPLAAARVALPPLVVLMPLLLGCGWWLTRFDPARVASAQSRIERWELGAWRFPVSLFAGGVVGGLLGIPLYALCWRAGRVADPSSPLAAPLHWSVSGLAGTLKGAWVDVTMASYLMPSPLLSSVAWGTAAATVVTILAWIMAWKARDRGTWQAIIGTCVALLLAAPGPITGMALQLAYRDAAIVERRSLIYDTPVIVVLALTARALPYAVLIFWPPLRAIPTAFLEGARVDGYRTWKVAVPLSRGAIATAWGVAFVLAFGELPASNIVSPPAVQTLPIFVWRLLHTGVESHLAGVGLILLLIFGAVSLLSARPLERLLE